MSDPHTKSFLLVKISCNSFSLLLLQHPSLLPHLFILLLSFVVGTIFLLISHFLMNFTSHNSSLYTYWVSFFCGAFFFPSRPSLTPPFSSHFVPDYLVDSPVGCDLVLRVPDDLRQLQAAHLCGATQARAHGVLLPSATVHAGLRFPRGPGGGQER